MTVRISNWKRFERNTLKGSFTATMPSGLVIHMCSLHEKNGSRWIGLPVQKYTKQDGSEAYSVLVEFTSRETADRFRKQVLLALEAEGILKGAISKQ